MATERLQVILSMAAGQYKSEARQAAQATGKIGVEASKTGVATGKLGGRMTALGQTAKIAIAGVATAAFFKLASGAAQAANDLNESMNAVNTVFDDAADTIDAFGQVSAQAVGLSTREFNQLSIVTGSLLQNLGFAANGAANETIRLTQRASDMASVFNTDVGTALSAINSALKGESNPIEQFGVKLNDASVKARAVALGLADTTAEVDENAKAVARLDIIYEQTSKTQGDFIKTSDELANSQRRAAAAWENAQARFGQTAIPVLTGLANFASDALLSFPALFGDEMSKAQLRINEAMQQIVRAFESGGDPLTALADGLLHIAQNSDLTAGQFEALAAAAGLGIDQFEDFESVVLSQARAIGLDEEIIRELAWAIDTTGQESDSAASEVEDFGDAVGDAGGEAGGAAGEILSTRDAIEELITSTSRYTDPAFRLLNDLAGLAEAQKVYNEAQDANDTAALEAALFGLLEAQAQVETSSLNYAEVAGPGVIDVFANLAREAGIAGDDLEIVLGILRDLNGQTFQATLDVAIQTHGGEAVARGTAGLITPGSIGLGGPLTRHSGGYVEPMVPYSWRPQDEMLISAGGGLVTSRPDTDRIIAALEGSGGGTSVQNITLQSTGDTARDAQVVSLMLANRSLVRGGLRGGAF